MKAKKKYKQVKEAKFMQLLGGRKMAMRQMKDTEELNKARQNPDEWAKIVNFGLPEITDMEGPAEC